MTRFISLNKLSAKKRKAIISANRRTWGFNPVTRVKPSGKTYNRKRTRWNDYDNDFTVSYFCLYMVYADITESVINV